MGGSAGVIKDYTIPEIEGSFGSHLPLPHKQFLGPERIDEHA